MSVFFINAPGDGRACSSWGLPVSFIPVFTVSSRKSARTPPLRSALISQSAPSLCLRFSVSGPKSAWVRLGLLSPCRPGDSQGQMPGRLFPLVTLVPPECRLSGDAVGRLFSFKASRILFTSTDIWENLDSLSSYHSTPDFSR